MLCASRVLRLPSLSRRSFASTAGLQEKIVALCRHRGFVFPGSDIYGGLANSFDYGPLGTSDWYIGCTTLLQSVS